MPRMLIVKTTSLGDVIHNLPVIHDIRDQYPDMAIDWVVEESFADIPHLHPDVDRVLTVALRRWRKQPFTAQTWHEISTFRQQLQSRPYDLVLDTQGLLKSALICRLAKAPRHGYDRHSIREPLASCLYDQRHAVSRAQHAVPRIRQLAAQALRYPVPDTAPDYGIAATADVSDLKLPAEYIIGLHGSSRDSKLWPLDHWIDLARRLHMHGLSLAMPWGSQAEHARAAEIAANTPDTIVLPRLGLDRLAGIIARAHAAVGVDTGLMHLATALKIPSVAIYTDTDPALTGVHPGRDTIAVNLGGRQQMPCTDLVIQTLRDHGLISSGSRS
ncbi:MAG TPA: lipopolysaccharide heptosyltransferase I [Methylophilaceae bacterium]